MSSQNGTDPLAPLARLVGGRWYYVSGSIENPPLTYHTYEWGAGNKAIHSRSCAADDTVMVEGLWYWHPGENVCKAIALGPMMGHALFDIARIEVEGDRMLTQLHAHSPEGHNTFAEEWVFAGKDAYDWTLFVETPEGRNAVSNARFERRENTK